MDRRLLLAAGLAAALAAPAAAQIAVAVDVSVGPSLTTVGASGTVEAVGVPLSLGRVDFPTAVGVDARARVSVWGRALGARFGAGYLSASDVFDGASLFNQDGIDVRFAAASAEVALRRPLGRGLGGTLVLGLGPEVRVLLGEGSAERGLTQYLGDVRESHLAVGASVGAQFRVGGVVVGPEVRGGAALTPFSDDEVEALGGRVRLDGAFRFDHVSVSLTVGV